MELEKSSNDNKNKSSDDLVALRKTRKNLYTRKLSKTWSLQNVFRKSLLARKSLDEIDSSFQLHGHLIRSKEEHPSKLYSVRRSLPNCSHLACSSQIKVKVQKCQYAVYI